jgi:serine/threonine protein kinase
VLPHEQSPLLADRYRLTERIGSGGMGVVWAAVDELLNRDVAVKEVLPAHRERIEREARVAARVSHPHVVTVYDLIYDEDRPWLVMQLVRSRPLSAVVRDEGPLPPRQVAAIGRQVLAGLAAVHEQGILHCDIKPGNVLLDERNDAHLTDFGIAADTGTESSGTLFGAPAYIAPERARGLHIGPASDLWSLGATLYAAVEGKAPIDRGDPLATITAVVNEEPAPAERAGPLRPLLEGLLKKDPEQRLTFEEAERLLCAVAETQETITIRPQAIPAPREHEADPNPTSVTPEVKRRAPLLLAGAALTAAAVVVAVPLLGLNHATPSSSGPSQATSVSQPAAPAAQTPGSGAATTQPAVPVAYSESLAPTDGKMPESTENSAAAPTTAPPAPTTSSVDAPTVVPTATPTAAPPVETTTEAPPQPSTSEADSSSSIPAPSAAPSSASGASTSSGGPLG